MNEPSDPRDAPRHRLSHAAQQRIAKRTIVQALGGVGLLVTAVFTLTGRCAENPNALRRLQAPVQAASAEWVLLSTQVAGMSVPFVMSVPIEEAQEGAALPSGLIVNGLEEIPIGVQRVEGGFEVPMEWLGATLSGQWKGNDQVEGTWTRQLADGQTVSHPMTGYRIPDALPERRYAVRPDLPAAASVRQPLPTRYAIDIGGAQGVLRYRTSTTHAVDVTVFVAGKSFGALAGSLYGRFLQASHFDGRSAALLQVTFSQTGETLEGFLSVNGDVQPITGAQLAERKPIAQYRELTSDEVAEFAVPTDLPAIVWYTSSLRSENHRVARGLAEVLESFPTSPAVILRCMEPKKGFEARRTAWLSYYGIDAELEHMDAEDAQRLPPGSMVFVNRSGTVVRAYQGIHGPDTGGSFRKQQSVWRQAVQAIVGGPSVREP